MISGDYLSPSSDLEREIDIKNHSGGIWNCIGKRESIYGGHVYEFVSHEEYDCYTPHSDLASRCRDCMKKTMEMYPAVEPSLLDIWHLCNDKSVIDLTLAGAAQRQLAFFRDQLPSGVAEEENLKRESDFLEELERNRRPFEEVVVNGWTSSQKSRDDIAEIGYRLLLGSDNLLHLELPDLEALQNGWKHFQKTHPDIVYPDLDVVSSEGIASDLDFFHSYREHDALLSNGKEFVHDHLVHVKTRISRMLKGEESYQKEKTRIIGLIDHYRTTIDTAIGREREQNGESGILHRETEKLNFIIGMLTDVYFSYELDIMIELINVNGIEQTLSSPYTAEINSLAWDNYLQERFGPETNFRSIQQLWKEVRKYVPYVQP